MDQLERLQHALADRSMPVDPRFDPIRSDPRYTRLVRRIGLPAS